MSNIVVRPPATPEELALHFRGDLLAFSHRDDPAYAAIQQAEMFNTPGFHQKQIHCVFLDGEQAGGCIVHERELLIGQSRLLTGCIGGVFTYPDYRKRGVAAALMRDVIEYARSRHYALLLLDGIPNFYHRYGYIDVYDNAIKEVFRASVLALPPSPYTVRPATAEDAAEVLALYERNFGAYIGSFARSLEWQRYQIEQYYAPHKLLWLVLDEQGQVQGYLWHYRKEKHVVAELAVDNWEATVALIQHHAQICEEPEAPQTLRYLLPEDAPVTQWLTERLRVPETTVWSNASYSWSLSAQTYRYYLAGWMARPVDVTELVNSMLPEWQERWQRSLAHWSGDLSIHIDNEPFYLHIANSEVMLWDESTKPPAHVLKLTSQAFVQLLFGYRSVSQILRQNEQTLPADVRTVLSILFPTGNAWIARSDWF